MTIMCKFCDNLRKQKEKNSESGALYRYHADLVTEAIHGGLHRSYGRENSHYELNYCPECGKKLSQLRECPYCGQEAAELRPFADQKGIKNGFYVICTNIRGGCGASTFRFDTEEEAVKSWNRRYRK